ncbi:peptidylprolyl isomerase [Methylobacter sp. YRD-M1]|uniref:peptidylprolyl isomerase n=1 Tax=Methylobacter sp. YRD-M1 TaxID=2911520 RepID=UPI00227C4B8B|nr:peptidyl-prolyl cis-trans isomerase [Methylobacter sp. YRD-M1]WAK00793.1 peptidylprolyl isomerase [Methylobacter sp. YRD-M1]
MPLKKISLLFWLSCTLCGTAVADTVLVKVGNGQVTEQQLEKAMSAAPFASQFPSMDEKDQAYLRGDMLMRLARSEALHQEAVALGKTENLSYQQEMGNFRTSLLAQRYLTHLRDRISIPAKLDSRLKGDLKGNGEALAAARASYVAQQFKALKDKRIAELKQQARIKTYFERLDNHVKSDTVLAEATDYTIKYADLLPSQGSSNVNSQQIKDKVNEWLELMVLARAAVAEGIDVEAQVADYGHYLSIKMLLAEQEQQWIPDDKTLFDYFRKHPNIGYVHERRQIGQLVVASREQAEKLRRRILAGESLFKLAAEYSIDPYGREHAGDMGWLQEGSGFDAIEQVLKRLPDNQVSDVIQTPKGWHLVMITARKPAERKEFAAIKDRVRQALIAEKMTAYLEQIMAKYPLDWQMQDHI